jgi:cupin superfamily acireductone dioxygenase involved in methionine salvage
MDDFELDIYEKYQETKYSSIAQLGRKIIKENRQHERIKKILDNIRFYLSGKIGKMDILLEKYKNKKGKKAKQYIIDMIQKDINKLMKAKELIDEDIKYLENKEKQCQRSITLSSKDNYPS